MFVPSFPSLKAHLGKQQSRAPAAQHRCEELSTRLHAYTFRRRLGRGAFGQVFLTEVEDTNYASPKSALGFGGANCKVEKQLVAVKVIRRTKLKESTRLLVRAEAENLRRIAGSGSLLFTQLRETFCDAHNLYIVTDYLQGGILSDEMDRRHKNGGFPRDRIVLIMAQLVEALSHLRTLCIVHRDIKPDNILLDACGNVVLADFGLSRGFELESSASENVFKHNIHSWRSNRERSPLTCSSRLSIFKLRERHEKGKERKDSANGSDVQCSVVALGEVSSTGAGRSCLTDTGCGTLAYAAPEMYRWESYSFPADVYSLGVVFYEILFDRLPPLPPMSLDPDASNDSEWFLDASRKKLLSRIDPIAVHLSMFLLALDPSKRISLPELRSHPFFSGVHWPTIAAHAYTLPAHHAPSQHPLKDLAHCGTWINQAVFVDPTVVLEDGPDGGLADAYNVQGCLEMEERPAERRKRLSCTKTGRVILGVREEVMQVCDFVRGREGRVRVREWANDVSYTKKLSFKSVGSGAGGNPGGIDVKIKDKRAVESMELTDAPNCISVTATAGHRSSSSLSRSPSAQITEVAPEREEYPPKLRRITNRIPHTSRPCYPCAYKPRISPIIPAKLEDKDSSRDRISTLAIFSHSPKLFGVEDAGEAEVNIGDNTRISADGQGSKPTLPCLSTSLPLSSPDEPRSFSPSSPFLSPNGLSIYITRVLGHVFPSSAETSMPDSFPLVSIRTGDARMPSVSSCPSLLPPASRTTTASVNSTLPVTPERSISYLPVSLQPRICIPEPECELGVNVSSLRKQDLSCFVNETSSIGDDLPLRGCESIRRRTSCFL